MNKTFAPHWLEFENNAGQYHQRFRTDGSPARRRSEDYFKRPRVRSLPKYGDLTE